MFYVDRKKCNGCGLCAEACPQQAIRVSGKAALIDQELCAGCGACREVCGNNAIYEVEVISPAAARVAGRPRVPEEKAGPAILKEKGKGATLPAALAALAPVVIEGLAALAGRWVTSGKGPGGKRGAGGRGRRCKRWL